MIKHFTQSTSVAALGAAFAFSVSAIASTIVVDPNDTRQEVIGFGAASVYNQGWIMELSPENQKMFYDTAFTGLNLSLLRIGNWKQEDDIFINHDITIINEARKRLGKDHFKIQMSSWSAPGRLKGSGSTRGMDGYNRSEKSLKRSNNDPYGKYVYSEFAHWWKHSYEIYESLGIAPDYVSLQNELDWPAEYEETLFDPKENDEVAGYPQALQAVRDSFATLKNPPKIIGPEPLGIGYEGVQRYMRELDKKNLDGIAYHMYNSGEGHDNASENYLNPENFRNTMKGIADAYQSETMPVIMTELCPMNEKTREQDMIGLAHILQVGFTSGKLSGYIAWMLFWGGVHGQFIGVCPGNGWNDCKEQKVYINPEYHGMRHYSKFVNPGWRVVSSKASCDKMYTVAFRSADKDSLTVVVINKTGGVDKLQAPEIEDYEPIYAIQSVEGGDKSKPIDVAKNYDLPNYSVITLVYKQIEKENAIPTRKLHYSAAMKGEAQIFDLNGNVVWKGLATDALNEYGTLKPALRQGSYVIKSGASYRKVVKRGR